MFSIDDVIIIIQFQRNLHCTLYLMRYTHDFLCFDVLYNTISVRCIHGVCLTHWHRNKMANIWQTSSSNTFSSMESYVFRIRLYSSLFPETKLTMRQRWFPWWLGAFRATSQYLNQCLHSQWMHMCITRPQWVIDMAHSFVGLASSLSQCWLWPQLSLLLTWLNCYPIMDK